MQLTINGDIQDFDEQLTVAALVEKLDMGQRRIAVELNGEILPRSRHASHQLQDGDALEIVHAIGGG